MPTRLPLLLLGILLAQGCAPQERTSTPVASVAPVSSVTKVPAGAEGLAYGLASGTCAEGSCPLAIQLLSGGKHLDSAALDFAASGPALTREEGESGLAERPPLEAWTAGSEEGAVTTALLALRLTSARIGLLVHQAAGFEHVKRRHDLFINDGAKLKRVWFSAEGAGPAWSRAEVVPAGDGQTDEIIHMEGFSPGGSEADTLTARRLAWDEARQELAERPLGTLPAITVGEFPDADAARQAAVAFCMAEYWVLPADQFGGAVSKVVLALVAARRETIESEMARPCDEKPPRRIAEFRSVRVEQ